MTKQTVKIFIASAGELAAEREKMVVLLSEINKQFPHLHLEAVKWETDMASGSYGQRVQDTINPLLDRSDVVVFCSTAGRAYCLVRTQLGQMGDPPLGKRHVVQAVEPAFL